MTPSLTDEQKQALDKNEGLLQGPSYVLMSKETYIKLLGLEKTSSLKASLKAIKEGLRDVKAKRTKPFRDVLKEL